MKSQAVRLVDVFLLGPFMVWAGLRLKDPLTRALLVTAGGATIGYNWANYERVRAALRAQGMPSEPGLSGIGGPVRTAPAGSCAVTRPVTDYGQGTGL